MTDVTTIGQRAEAIARTLRRYKLQALADGASDMLGTAYAMEDAGLVTDVAVTGGRATFRRTQLGDLVVAIGCGVPPVPDPADLDPSDLWMLGCAIAAHRTGHAVLGYSRGAWRLLELRGLVLCPGSRKGRPVVVANVGAISDSLQARALGSYGDLDPPSRMDRVRLALAAAARPWGRV